MKHYSIANRDRSFTVRYKDEEESLVEACVAAQRDRSHLDHS